MELHGYLPSSHIMVSIFMRLSTVGTPLITEIRVTNILVILECVHVPKQLVRCQAAILVTMFLTLQTMEYKFSPGPDSLYTLHC